MNMKLSVDFQILKFNVAKPKLTFAKAVEMSQSRISSKTILSQRDTNQLRLNQTMYHHYGNEHSRDTVH